MSKVLPIYLFWGEEFLVRREADALARTLVPDAAAGLNLAVLDAASPREIAAELMTLPLFPGRKVVVVRDPEFLAPKKGRVDALGKVREAWKAGRRKESAGALRRWTPPSRAPRPPRHGGRSWASPWPTRIWTGCGRWRPSSVRRG
jgi:hypothetical protein